jgi:hypothetical protein
MGRVLAAGAILVALSLTTNANHEEILQCEEIYSWVQLVLNIVS